MICHKDGGEGIYENSQTKMLKGDKVVNTKVQRKHRWRLLLISAIDNTGLNKKNAIGKRETEQKVTDVFMQNVYFTIWQLNESYIVNMDMLFKE